MNRLSELKCYIIMCFGIAFCFLVINGLGINDLAAIQLGMQLLILGSLIFAMFKNREDGLNNLHILYLIIWLGIVMRIGYMLYTPINVRSHDLGDISRDGFGHAAYIINLMEGHLPSTNYGQFYHPPLFHYLAAQVCKLVNIFLRSDNLERIVEASKVVSCFASCGMLILTKYISEELGLKEKGQLVAGAFVAFLPNFYLLAGRVNNDALAIFFMFVIILYTIRWYKEPTYKNVMILALAFGLGMMTKISVGMMALYTGGIMLYVLFKDPKGIKRQRIFGELVAFGGICFPLALWYPIRNKMLFEQAFSYVLEIPIDHPLYCGDYTWYQRFIGFPFRKTFSPIYNSPLEDYNVNVYLLKGALFGEFTFEINNFWSLFILVVYTLLMIFVVLSYLYLIYNYRQTKTFMTYTVCSITAIMYISYLYFNIQYPFGCTMDYRYVVPLALMNGLALGIGFEGLKEIKSKVVKYIRNSIMLVCIVFAMLSVVIFCNIGAVSTVLAS
nr:glycosyltransferase family 39 protein [uncultured Cellulosilyticum sp.]